MNLIVTFAVLLLLSDDPPIFSLSTQSGKVFTVTEAASQGAGLSEFFVTCEGFPHTRDTFRFETLNPVEQVFLADLDQNGFEEFYVCTRSAGSGSYSEIFGLASNEDLSATPFYLSVIPEDGYDEGGMFEGYRGHNKFYLENDKLINEFPVYNIDDVNSNPTGGMRKINYLLLKGEASWILEASSIISQEDQATPVRVYFLGGQSNMDGFGYNSELPASLNKVNRDVWIFHGNPAPDDDPTGGLGIWEPLQPGHGIGFFSDGLSNSLSDRFGVELTLAAMLQERYLGEKIAIIKYSREGTSIDSLAAANFGCWEPDYIGATGINQYDHFLKTVHAALSTRDMDGDGHADLFMPSGIVWMQGESDAGHTEETASRYDAHLKRLMDLFRASFHSDDLPVVIGKISDSGNDEDGKVWDHCELVQHAQEKYVKSDSNAAIVRSTRNYSYSDIWHYNSEGYIDLGEKFADALYKLDR